MTEEGEGKWKTRPAITQCRVNPYSAEIFCINHGDQRVFQFWIIINDLVSFICFICIPMVWVYYHQSYFSSFKAGIVFFQTSDSDLRFWRIQLLRTITLYNIAINTTWLYTPFPIATRHTLQWLKAKLFSWESCHTSITTRHTVIKTELFSWESCLCAKWCKQCLPTCLLTAIWIKYCILSNCILKGLTLTARGVYPRTVSGKIFLMAVDP